MARRHLRGESPGHAHEATALVHEVYLRLVDVDRMTLTNRAHFFGMAATLMRQIIVDYARRQRADKRGGSVTVLSLDDALPAAWTSSVDVLALDQALDALSAMDSRQCRVVELRFFAGLTIDEAATGARNIVSHGGARVGLGESLALSAIVLERVTEYRVEAPARLRRVTECLEPHVEAQGFRTLRYSGAGETQSRVCLRWAQSARYAEMSAARRCV